MGHTYISNYIHFVFSTKNRTPFLTPEIRNRLWEYIGGIAKQHSITPIIIGGYSDHCHALLLLPSTISLADAAKKIKGISSKWISESYPDLKTFSWQEGYGAFSVSISQVDDTIQYIRNQEEHHKKVSFQDEYIAFLKKHNIQFDDRYVLG